VQRGQEREESEERPWTGYDAKLVITQGHSIFNCIAKNLWISNVWCQSFETDRSLSPLIGELGTYRETANLNDK
jgi:hypothetical protein